MRRIAVLGDIILDQTTTVRTLGVSKENDAVVVAKEVDRSYNLGGAANVAANCKSLGGDPVLLGCANNIPLTHLVRDANITWVADRGAEGRTPIKNRIVTADGHYLLRLDKEDCPHGYGDEFWTAGRGGTYGMWINEALKMPDKPIFCLVDYDKGFLSTAACKYLMWQFNSIHESFKFPVIVDPGRNGNWGKYGSPRTIFRANMHQAMQHYVRNIRGGMTCPYDSVEQLDTLQSKDFYETAARRVAWNLVEGETAFKYVVLTLGPAGIVVADKEGNTFYHGGVRVERGDPCGAGDTVTAAMAVTLARMENPEDWGAITAAVSVASKASRIAVTKRGVYAVTKGDMGWLEARTEAPATT